MVILAGDINIDIIEYDNAETLQYLTTLLSTRFLPYKTLSIRITEYSATWSNRDRIVYENILAGILYFDIADHLPCVVSLKCINYIDNNDRPSKHATIWRENCENFVERTISVQWDLIYSEHTDWYNAFITNVRYHYNQSFPLVKVSRKILKGKPWVSKDIKISIKQNHSLYRASLRSNNASAVVEYKRYNKVLRRCIREVEMAYYDRLFQDIKTSSNNMWKHLDAIINPNKKKRICYIDQSLYDGNIITDHKIISDSMNTYFCNIGPHLQQLMPNCRKCYTR